jgi:hypothetical protein
VAIAVVDALDIAAVLEGRGTPVAHDDGVALVPIAWAAGLFEFGDDPAAVAVENPLLDRAVGPVGVDE